MTRIISFINLKGGARKTTITVATAKKSTSIGESFRWKFIKES